MKQEWVNPFLTALNTTFSSIGISYEITTKSVKVPPFSLNEITVDIGVTGGVVGKFQLTCPKSTALYIANKFKTTWGMGESLEFTDMEMSAFSEIVNQIGGATAGAFSTDSRGDSILINITPPSVLEGSHVISYLPSKLALELGLSLDGKPAVLLIALVAGY